VLFGIYYLCVLLFFFVCVWSFEFDFEALQFEFFEFFFEVLLFYF
jgi:hypothetical protein